MTPSNVQPFFIIILLPVILASSIEDDPEPTDLSQIDSKMDTQIPTSTTEKPEPTTMPLIPTIDYSYLKNIPLEIVPDPSKFHVNYSHFQLQDLGTVMSKQPMPPKTIKITKTVAVKVPSPYPVPITRTVPFPVPVHKPYPVTVTKIVYVPQTLTDGKLETMSEPFLYPYASPSEMSLSNILAKYAKPDKDTLPSGTELAYRPYDQMFQQMQRTLQSQMVMSHLQNQLHNSMSGQTNQVPAPALSQFQSLPSVQGLSLADQELLMKQLARQGFAMPKSKFTEEESRRLKRPFMEFDGGNQVFMNVVQRLRNNSERYGRGR